MNEQTRATLGYSFHNPALLQEALTHASIADTRLDSNERMEFLGDAVLGLVVSDYLFKNYPEYLEGELTKIKSEVVSRRACARIAEQRDIAGLLNIGKGMAKRADLPRSIAAAVYESVIAAIYLDAGLERVRSFILEDMEPMIDEVVRSAHQYNFKSVLQQFCQKQLDVTPHYVLLDEKGPDHSKCFQICVDVDGRRFDGAWANSKKEAEQKAALIALQELGIVSVADDGHVTLHSEALDALPAHDPEA